MAHIQGQDRNQTLLLPPSLDELIADDNPVRVIEAFVDGFDLKQLGFAKAIAQAEGRPPFHPSVLLKLYLYGYINGIRSSRKLEREAKRNIELLWLLGGLQPKYKTIADFRKNHPQQIKQFFRQFIVLLGDWKLIGGTLLAFDGSKFRAINSKKNNFNEKKIQRHLSYIDLKIEEHLQQMNENDKKDKDAVRIKKTDVQKKIKQLQQRRKGYELLEKQLKQSGEDQISTTDPESRALVIKTDIVEVSYNAQAAVDAQNNLIVNYDVTNRNDRKALAPMVLDTQQVLKKKKFDALADKGYHNAQQIDECMKAGVITFVAPQEVPHKAAVPTPDYYGEKFTYNKKKDCYTCPQGNEMRTNGHWYKKHREKYATLVKHYKTSCCKTCPARELCTTNPHGRIIERSQFQQAVEENNNRVKQQKEKYLLRQQICEHPFGTMKRQWGYTYTLMKGIRKVGADIGLMFTCYNLMRLMNIIGVKSLLRKLRRACCRFFSAPYGCFSSFLRKYFFQKNFSPIFSIQKVYSSYLMPLLYI